MSYTTISKKGESLYKEKGSKFLGFAIGCASEKEIKTHLELLREENPGACHVCYAFKLGYDGKHYRACDDGEPNNSAGQPILGQIQSFGVTQVLVAVVRYYGGTNLGVGGLIQAYRTAAKEALEVAEKKEKHILVFFELECSYEQFPFLMKQIKAQNVSIHQQELGLSCKMIVEIRDEESPAWVELMQRMQIICKTLKF